MTRLIALLAPALLLLGACSRPVVPAAEAGPDDAVAAECRVEARSSPEAREVWRRQVPANIAVQDRLQGERAVAEANAFDACMRRRGVRRGGGVERVRPQNSFW
jgi:hypothetical protein